MDALSAIFLFVVFLALYVYASIWLTRAVRFLTKRYEGRWPQSAAVSLTLAVLLAPSAVGFGISTAVIPVPAWVSLGNALSEHASRGYVTRWAVAPMVTAFFIFLGIELWRKKRG